MDFIQFPDPVTLAGTYLQQALADRGETVRVGSGAPPAHTGPKAARTPWIRILTGGGGSAGPVMADADLIVEAYADTEAEAYRLASLARGVLHLMAEQPRTGVHRLMSAGLPQQMDHPTGLARFTFNTTLRLTAAQPKD